MKKLKQLDKIEQAYQHIGSNVTLRTRVDGLPGIQQVHGRYIGVDTDTNEFYVIDDDGKEYSVTIGDETPSMVIHTKNGSLVLNKNTSIDDKLVDNSEQFMGDLVTLARLKRPMPKEEYLLKAPFLNVDYLN